MKYLFLAYKDAQKLAALPAPERETFNQACLANAEALRQNGHLLSAESLPNGQSTTTVQIQDGEVYLTDGPLTGTQGQLQELFFINARDLNEAIQVAAQMPQIQLGLIEVRPLNERPVS